MRRLLLAGAAGLASIVAMPSSAAPASGAPAAAEDASIESLLQEGRYVQALAAARQGLQDSESARGASAIETAAAIDRLVDVLGRCGLGGAGETRALAERALEIRRTAGTEDTGLADSLVNLGSTLSAGAEFRAAQEVLERALELRGRLLGPDAPATALVKERLGTLLANSGKADRSQALLNEAAASLQPEGKNDAALATVLTALGGLMTNRGNIAGARETLDRALAIRLRLFGPEHPEAAATLYRQAYLKRKEGDMAQSLALAERSLAIRKARLPAESLEIASTLGLRADLRFERGDLPGARADGGQALAMRKGLLRPGHPLIATSMKSYAGFLWDAGDYATARPLFEQALQIERQALGPAHPQVALSLTNLGNLFGVIGDYPEAVAHYEEALREGHSMAADQRGLLQVEMASALREMQRHQEARFRLQSALEASEAALGPDHFVAGWIRYNLGISDETDGDPVRAATEAERAGAILTAALGEDHVKLAYVALLQARLAAAAGRPEEAEPLFDRARRIFEKTLGPVHPEVANALADRAEARWRAGRVDQALDDALEAARIRREVLASASGALSEREALLFRSARGASLDLALSRIALADPAPSPGAIARVFDELIRARAQVLDEVAWRQRLARESSSDEARALIDGLEQARTRLSRATLALYGPGGSQADPAAIDRARADKEEAERALAQWSASERTLRELRAVSSDDVRRALPADAGLVSFVRYSRWPAPASRSGEGAAASPVSGGAGPSPAYLAFVVRSSSDDIAVVPLGPAEPIDADVLAWMALAGRPPKSADAMGPYRAAAARLAKRIWTPIASRVEGRALLLLVPDGLLQFVSWESLPAGAKTWLVESGPTIHLLSAERSLVRGDRATPSGRGLLAIGGPDFDSTGGGPPAAVAAVVKSGTAATSGVDARPDPALSPAVSRGCAAPPRRPMLALPSAAEEVRALGTQWTQASGASGQGEARSSGDGAAAPVTILTGREASETALRALAPGRRVLHLATHAFFLPSACGPETPAGLLSEGDEAGSGSADILVRTGLALAGANRAWGDRAADGTADGLLTGEEIASLDLRGVDWAVLSACGSSLGKAEAGEGILGLRRTFEVAGAGTLVTSLWDLEDHTARQWIRALYRARLAGASTADSVRQASRDILAARRRAGLLDHPYYWAAYVAAGDWR